MSNIDTFNLLVTIAIILLILIQVVVLTTVFMAVKRISKTVKDIKTMADDSGEIVRELKSRFKRQASYVSIAQFLIRRIIRHRKEA